jgi:hypothetical protein
MTTNQVKMVPTARTRFSNYNENEEEKNMLNLSFNNNLSMNNDKTNRTVNISFKTPTLRKAAIQQA